MICCWYWRIVLVFSCCFLLCVCLLWFECTVLQSGFVILVVIWLLFGFVFYIVGLLFLVEFCLFVSVWFDCGVDCLFWFIVVLIVLCTCGVLHSLIVLYGILVVHIGCSVYVVIYGWFWFWFMSCFAFGWLCNVLFALYWGFGVLLVCLCLAWFIALECFDFGLFSLQN